MKKSVVLVIIINMAIASLGFIASQSRLNYNIYSDESADGDNSVYTYGIKSSYSGVDSATTGTGGAGSSTGSSKTITAITKGPYLQNITDTSITICWETDGAGDSQVFYGLTPSYGMAVTDPGAVTLHQVTLYDLSPGTTYHYQVSSNGVSSEDSTFMTAVPPSGEFTMVVVGDTRTNHNAHQSVVNAILAADPDLILNSGDLVEDGNDWAQWGTFFDIIKPLARKVPYYPCWGNHEHHSQYYYDLFVLPHNEDWYSFDYGNVHIISFSSEHDYSVGSPQYNWLEADLQSVQASGKFIIAFDHRPPYNTGVSHGSELPLREALCPLFETYGVDIVFSGHEHIYEHNIVNGIHYIVTGGGGAPLSLPGLPQSWTVCHERAYHYCKLEFEPFSLYFEAVKPDGTVIDAFTLTIPAVNYPPAPPEIVEAMDTPEDNGGSITVYWSLSADDGQGWNDVVYYNVLRALTIEGDKTIVGTVPAGTTTFIDTSAIDGLDYYYTVQVSDGTFVTNSTVYGPVQSLDNLPPAPPTSVLASDTTGDNGGSITVQWLKSADDGNGANDVIEYWIYRATVPASYDYNIPLAIVDAGTTTYIDTDVIDGTYYYYIVKAFDGNHLSINSNEAGPAEAYNDAAPSAPSGLCIGTVTNTTITLHWNANQDPDVAGYQIYMRIQETTEPYELVAEVGLVTSYTVPGLAEGTMYAFKLRAFDPVPNFSTFSVEVSATTFDFTPPGVPELEPLPYTLTNDPMLTITGATEPGAQVELIINDNVIASVTTDKLGKFEFTIRLGEGNNSIQVRAIDASGNIGELSEPLIITLDTLPPEVVAVAPERYEIGVAINTTIAVIFSEHVKECMVDNAISIRSIKGKSVSGIIIYVATDYKLVFTPLKDLEYDTRYTIRLLHVNIEDLAGNMLPTDYLWQFTTVSPDAGQKPVIESIIPATHPEITVGDKITFSVVATDPNNDLLYYYWFVEDSDGNLIDKLESSPNYVFDATDIEGEAYFAIKLEVSDGKYTVVHEWLLKVREAPEQKLVPQQVDKEIDGIFNSILFLILIAIVSIVTCICVFVYLRRYRKKRKHREEYEPKDIVLKPKRLHYTPSRYSRYTASVYAPRELPVDEQRYIPRYTHYHYNYQHSLRQVSEQDAGERLLSRLRELMNNGRR